MEKCFLSNEKIEFLLCSYFFWGGGGGGGEVRGKEFGWFKSITEPLRKTFKICFS